MAGISQDTWNELRRFVRAEGPMEDEPEDMGDLPGMDNAPPGAVAIEVKSEPEAGKTCPACGQHMP